MLVDLDMSRIVGVQMDSSHCIMQSGYDGCLSDERYVKATLTGPNGLSISEIRSVPATANVVGGTAGFSFPLFVPYTEYAIDVVGDGLTLLPVTIEEIGIVTPGTSFTVNSSTYVPNTQGDYEVQYQVLLTDGLNLDENGSLPPGYDDDDVPNAQWPEVTAVNHSGYSVLQGGTINVPWDEGVLCGAYLGYTATETLHCGKYDDDPEDEDPGEQVLTVDTGSVQGPPASAGTVTVNTDGSFIFTAAAGFIGQTFFRIIVHGGGFASLLATVYMQVKPPTEKMYAIDGTGADHDGSNVHHICTTLSIEKCEYFRGPERIIDGGDSPKILKNVERAIAKDLAAARSMGQQLEIDLIGWSRGAVIAATVARDLQSLGSFEGKPFRSDVRFVGLFDAVNQMGANVTTPGGWATTFSTNVLAHYHLIHTYHGVCLDFPAENEDDVYPTVTTLTETTEYFRPNPISGEQTQLAMHYQVGRDPKSRDMMVTAARAAGVKIQ